MTIFHVASGAALSALLVFWILLPFRDRRRRLRLPPGPTGVPFFGNSFDIPKTYEWITYKKWSREFGSSIIHLDLMGTPMVVLHSLEDARQLFEKRSALYSDRQAGVMVNELIGWDGLLGFMQYGSRWRDTRRAVHQNFTSDAVSAYYPSVTRGSRTLLLHLLDNPSRFMDHLRHMSGELIMRVVYGINVKSEDDPHITIAETAIQSTVAGNAGTYLVDAFPILKHIPIWFPGASFKRDALAWRKDVLAMMDMPFSAVKQALGRGDAEPSILSSQLNKLDESRDNAYEEGIFRSAAASAYVGGADTTVSSLGTFILAMLMYPEVQKRAQIELDSVVGRSRLPEFEDEDSLPCISAIVKEVFRWQPVTPLAVPHRLIADDEYMGYYLPAGTLVVGNSWAMLHDERKYPHPEQFRPERYLREDGTLNPSAPDPSEAAFGFGRRICPGRHLARASVWMAVANILATFDIRKAVDEGGITIEPRIEYTPGLISYPVPFVCSFKPRFAEAEKLIRLDVEDV